MEAGDGNECLPAVVERDQPFHRGFLAVTLDRKTCRCSGARSHWRGQHQRQILCYYHYRQYCKLYEVQL